MAITHIYKLKEIDNVGSQYTESMLEYMCIGTTLCCNQYFLITTSAANEL